MTLPLLSLLSFIPPYFLLTPQPGLKAAALVVSSQDVESLIVSDKFEYTDF